MRAIICALLALAAVPATAHADLRIGTLSTRPDTVTGGDVLVRIQVAGVSPDRVVVDLDGRDVTDAFRARGSLLTGLVTGLADGPNRLTARAGRDEDRLVLHNHPITGPVFSGPQEQPFVCETESFVLPRTRRRRSGAGSRTSCGWRPGRRTARSTRRRSCTIR